MKSLISTCFLVFSTVFVPNGFAQDKNVIQDIVRHLNLTLNSDQNPTPVFPGGETFSNNDFSFDKTATKGPIVHIKGKSSTQVISSFAASYPGVNCENSMVKKHYSSEIQEHAAAKNLSDTPVTPDCMRMLFFDKTKNAAERALTYCEIFHHPNWIAKGVSSASAIRGGDRKILMSCVTINPDTCSKVDQWFKNFNEAECRKKRPAANPNEMRKKILNDDPSLEAVLGKLSPKEKEGLISSLAKLEDYKGDIDSSLKSMGVSTSTKNYYLKTFWDNGINEIVTEAGKDIIKANYTIKLISSMCDFIQYSCGRQKPELEFRFVHLNVISQSALTREIAETYFRDL